MAVIGQINLPLQHRILEAIMAAGVFCSLLVLFIVPPADLPIASCAFHAITGHNCLTCGMTRSLHAISHGEFAASIRYHLLGPAVFLVSLLCLVIFSTEAVSGKRSAMRIDRKIRNRAAVAFAVVWFVYWGVRLATEFAT